MQDAARALREVALLGGVADDDLLDLAAVTYPKRLSRGQVLFTTGESSENLYVVESGRLKVLVVSARGDELVLTVLGPGEALGELSVLDGSPRSASAVALDDVSLWCVPAEAVRTLLRASPAAALSVAEELAGQVRRLTGTAADLVFLDLPRRLAKLLVSDEAAGRAVTSLSQSEVAAQLGVTRQSLNRALQRLQDRGWVEVRRSGVEVLDPSALQRFSDS